jgi:hypothetical protein
VLHAYPLSDGGAFCGRSWLAGKWVSKAIGRKFCSSFGRAARQPGLPGLPRRAGRACGNSTMPKYAWDVPAWALPGSWSSEYHRFIIDMAKPVILLLALVLARGPSAPQPPHSVSQRPGPPRQIKIGAVVYTIELVEKVPPAGDASALAGKACDDSAVREGWCAAKDYIYLEMGRTLQQERTTLLHEIQHVIFGTEHSDEETTYHDFIYKLSPKLLQVLQDNPDLLFYLTAPGPK